MSRPPSDLTRGALLMVAAAVLFAFMAAGVQLASERLPNAMVVFFRNAVALVFLAPFVLRGGLAQMRTRRLGEHALRTAAGLISAVAQTGIRRMTATEPTLRIVVYFAFLSTIVSAAPLTIAWVTPGPPLLVLLLLVGATAAAAQFLMTRAYSYAPAAQVGA